MGNSNNLEKKIKKWSIAQAAGIVVIASALPVGGIGYHLSDEIGVYSGMFTICLGFAIHGVSENKVEEYIRIRDELKKESENTKNSKPNL